MKVNIYKKTTNKKVPPKHSITAVIPNYNYADFIIERIDSILMQTYPISELIILDDASTDNSVAVIKRKLADIKLAYPKLTTKFIQNSKNSGGCVFSQWQKGIEKASGDYLWIAEADDSANSHFLETAMQKFEEYPSACLFYSDSFRINQRNEVISHSCSDWADMQKTGRYKKDFFNYGIKEIKEYFSGTNPILNVSSVVWKNTPNLFKIFEEAKKFKVAGDWYIYSRVLESGDIVYSAKPLNYYRKHEGSASTVVKLNIEYGEVTAIQERIIKKYKLGNEYESWAKVRRRGMGFVENEKNIGDKGTIAWVIPAFSTGSGGHRTIFNNINYLIDHGYRCDAYINGNRNELPINIFERIEKNYGEFKADVFTGYELAKKYDTIIATGWDTAEPVALSNSKNKLYFIQDFEPFFFPRSGEYIAAERSYSLGLRGITIGKWLTQKISNNYPTETNFFHFCADLRNYQRIDNVEKENAICYIFQPGKPRRCDQIALKALQIVQKISPDTKIYLYGSAKRKIEGLKVEHLGEITVKECNELYNRCSVGLCMSASNPSRIPFEMMASGLPVVELYLENNLYDLPENGCLLAEPTSEGVATALLEILGNKKMRSSMSDYGQSFMKDFPLERGYQEFLDFIDDICSGHSPSPVKKQKPIYNLAPVVPSAEVKNISKSLPSISYTHEPTTKELIKKGLRIVYRRTRGFVGRKIRSAYHKIFR